MKTKFTADITINITERYAKILEAHCAAHPGVSPASMIEAWVADKLDKLTSSGSNALCFENHTVRIA
jgi:hypothetical protein